MDCTIYVSKTKALISFSVTAKLICVFVFEYAKSRFSHDAAHLKVKTRMSYHRVKPPKGLNELQTVKTQIRLLLEEQSDLGLHCLAFAQT